MAIEENYRDRPAHQFAREIADAMGPQWRYDDQDVTNSRCAHLDGPAGFDKAEQSSA